MSLQNPDNHFPLDMKWDFTQIDFVNPTITPVTIDIFNSITISNFNTTSGSGFYIDSPYNYNSLLLDIQSNPMLIRRIEMIVQNQNQFTQAFNIMKRDANGNQLIVPKLPNIELSVNQIQPNIASIDFKEKELILDDNTMFSQYTFQANSTIRMLLFYKQMNRIDLITKGISQCKEIEEYMNFQDTFITEVDLRKFSNQPLIVNAIIQEKKKQNRLAYKAKLLKNK